MTDNRLHFQFLARKQAGWEICLREPACYIAGIMTINQLIGLRLVAWGDEQSGECGPLPQPIEDRGLGPTRLSWPISKSSSNGEFLLEPGWAGQIWPTLQAIWVLHQSKFRSLNQLIRAENMTKLMWWDPTHFSTRPLCKQCSQAQLKSRNLNGRWSAVPTREESWFWWQYLTLQCILMFWKVSCQHLLFHFQRKFKIRQPISRKLEGQVKKAF